MSTPITASIQPGEIRAEILDGLASVDSAEWNALAADSPFLRHEFLLALEHTGCLKEYGWHARHVVLRSSEDELIGALPLYIKTNSYGEFVFDWSWESAFTKSGRRYYPKLVNSIPYTPASGKRLLVADGPDAADLRKILIRAAIEFAEQLDCSGVHWLFTEAADNACFRELGFPMRMGCQYHWQNEGYENFDAFLQRLISRKRKKIKRERERVREQGIQIRIISGRDCSPELWETLHGFYTTIFDRKNGAPTLSLDFFKQISQTMGEQIVLVIAELEQVPVACAINLRSDDTLYGRIWGCEESYHSLHFEVCYYQGIGYCISQGLKRFEPGAQGEHKIGRGFLPTPTWSAHWIRDEAYKQAIADFCKREQKMMVEQCEALRKLSPFRDDSDDTDNS